LGYKKGEEGVLQNCCSRCVEASFRWGAAWKKRQEICEQIVSNVQQDPPSGGGIVGFKPVKAGDMGGQGKLKHGEKSTEN